MEDMQEHSEETHGSPESSTTPEATTNDLSFEKQEKFGIEQKAKAIYCISLDHKTDHEASRCIGVDEKYIHVA
jgi:hypothetical protein